MLKFLTKKAIEGSTYIVECSFFDEDHNVMVPASDIVWSLEDAKGELISNGTITADSVVNIVLSGSDLGTLGSETKEELRKLIVSTTYDSTYGAGLSLVESITFRLYPV